MLGPMNATSNSRKWVSSTTSPSEISSALNVARAFASPSKCPVPVARSLPSQGTSTVERDNDRARSGYVRKVL